MTNQVNIAPGSFGTTNNPNTRLNASVLDNGFVVYLTEENKKGLAQISYNWRNDSLIQEKKAMSLLEKMMQEFNLPNVKIITPRINRIYSKRIIDSLTDYFSSLKQPLDPEVLDTPYSDGHVSVYSDSEQPLV
jgi:hypothetical protein